MAEKCTAVVGVGASAGGLQALKDLLTDAQPDPRLSFIIVTHRGERQDSVLDSILSGFSPVPVRSVEEGAPPEPGALHVMPPNSLLTFDESGCFHLRKPSPNQRLHNAIDVFFDSLASHYRESAIAIVLSGSGSDGALGVKAIKEHGGLTLAQGKDHSEPLFASMPDAAILTGGIDLVLPAQEIIGRINRLVAHPRATVADQDATENTLATVEDHRQEICSILRNQVGHDFAGYKNKTFLRRVHRRMHVHQITDGVQYVAHLRQHPDEVEKLFRELLIGVTSFFRDPEVFKVLEAKVIPDLFHGRGAQDSVRIWIPGCATGEEVYSIAILMREHMDTLSAVPKVQIFATDIDDTALGVARAARYPVGFLEEIPRQRRERFFSEDGGLCQVAKEVRDLCMFSLHSIIRDPPFSRMDLVSCRNLLIYLDGGLQGTVIPLFHYALRRGGFLLLGTAENLGKHDDLFDPLDKKCRLFVRRERSGAPVHLLLPERLRSHPIGAPQGTGGTNRTRALSDAVNRRILDRHAPAHVVINGHGDIAYFSSRTSTYLETPSGPPNSQLIAIARPELRQHLRALLDDVVQKQRRVVAGPTSVQVDDRRHLVQITIEPIEEGGPSDQYLVVFAEKELPSESSADPAAGAFRESEAMETELHDTRERLQSMIEEYETAMEELKSANEEMLSVNEELQSANEELETSKEELQSINEELHAVNHELNIKVEELDRANSDLRNIFESTNVATVFLDSNRIIRAFTPAARDIFRLIDSDIGRPLTDIASSLDYPELHDEIVKVLSTAQWIERRVSHGDQDRHYLVRLIPYRRSDQELDGVVVTFVDISEIARGERQQSILLSELNHRVRNMLAVVASLAQMSLDHTPARDRYVQRLISLGRTYELLTHDYWHPVALHRLAEIELEPYGTERSQRVTLSGPGMILEPEGALALGMVFHELATNAVKYGALHAEKGKVGLTWECSEDPSGPVLVIRWQESDGPPPPETMQPNFGQRLIEQQVRHGLNGTIAYEWSRQGLVALITAPIGGVVKAQDSNAVSSR